MKFLKNIVNKGKNATLSIGLENVFKNLVKEYADLLYFKFDSDARFLEFELMLKGELSSLKVKIEKYIIIKKKKKHYIIVSKLITSREWINILAEEYVVDLEILLPDEYAAFYEMLSS